MILILGQLETTGVNAYIDTLKKRASHDSLA